MIVTGIVFYNLHLTSSFGNVLIVYMLGFMSIFALGFLVASLVPNARIAPIVGVILFLPMIYLSGATVPLKLYPPVVQQIALFLPLTHVVRLLQDMWFSGSWLAHWVNVLVLLGLLVVCLFASSKLFRWR